MEKSKLTEPLTLQGKLTEPLTLQGKLTEPLTLQDVKKKIEVG